MSEKKPWKRATKMDGYCHDRTEMTFGKHKGEKLGDVPASYLLWACDQEEIIENCPGLIGYINSERSRLEKEYKLEQEQRREKRR